VVEVGFDCPSGPLGWLGGWLMARGNADTERHMVEDKRDKAVVHGHALAL
jgi:hypothetical protein